MSYLRCTACGAKALRAASQCPRCTTPFALTDARGRRVPLTPCRGCGYLHRVDTPCHWCGVLPPPTWRQPSTYRRAAGVVLSLGVAVAAWRTGFPSRAIPMVTGTEAPRAGAPVAGIATPTAPVSVTPVPSDPPAARGALDVAAVGSGVPVSQPSMPPQASLAPAPTAATAAGGSAADSVRWVPAVARTWVNVRANASRDGAVVGVISPASRALLEAGRSGWRRVRASDVRGWVDPRLFVADSSARRDG